MRIETLRDVETFETVPYEQRWRGRNTYELLERSAEKFGERPALKFQFTADLEEEPLTISYRALLENLRRAANAFHRAGVQPGGVISVILPNLPETHYTLWGAQALGIVAPVNPLLSSSAIRELLTESETEALVVEGPVDGSETWSKVLAIADEVPTLKALFYVCGREQTQDVAEQTPGGMPIREFHAAIQGENPAGLSFSREISTQDIAAYFHTGGTTGTPKIARQSHGNQVHIASMMSDYRGMGPHTVTFGALPLIHVNAFFNAGLTIFACGGHAVYLTPAGFRNKAVVANFWRFVEKYRPTFFMAVPTMVSSLLEQSLENIDLGSLEYIVCGAAPISPEVFRQFQRATGANIIEAYGLTEGTVSSSANPQHGEKRVGSIGIRTPYQQMKCVLFDDNDEYLRDCKPDEPGVIVIKGPNVFAGYKQAQANEGAFVDGWFITGDLAREDSDGYFWMTGRAKDLIIRGGHNIDPKIIEDTLATHPNVALAAAVGQPDAYAGELPCAFVTLKRAPDGGNGDAVAELLDFARQNITERGAAPVHIEILQSMPLTAVGKVFKPTLRGRAIKRVFEAAAKEVGCAAEVEVINDERRGLVARVSLQGSEESRAAAAAALDRYPVTYDLMNA